MPATCTLRFVMSMKGATQGQASAALPGPGAQLTSRATSPPMPTASWLSPGRFRLPLRSTHPARRVTIAAWVSVPRVTYFCLGCDLPLVLRQYVRCPSCQTMHSGLTWGKGNAFGHWFGLFCPDCGASIPTLLNVFSMIIAAASAPLWYPVWRLVRGPWIERERIRAHRMNTKGEAHLAPVKRWVLRWALGWGVPFWQR